MALQTSGPISISNIKAELGSTSNSLRALSAAAGKSTPDAMSEFYGYSSFDPAWVDIHSYSPEAGASISGQGIASNPWVISTNLTYYGTSPYGGDYWAFGEIEVKVYPTYLGPINLHLKITAHSPTLSSGSDPQEIVFSKGGTPTFFSPRQLISGDGAYSFVTNGSYPYPIGTEFVNQYGTSTTTTNETNYFSMSYEEYYAGNSPVVPRWTWNVWFTPG
jgi:hypothetical protein